MTVLKLVLNDKTVIHDPFGSDIKSRKADNLLIISLSLLFSCGGLTFLLKKIDGLCFENQLLARS